MAPRVPVTMTVPAGAGGKNVRHSTVNSRRGMDKKPCVNTKLYGYASTSCAICEVDFDFADAVKMVCDGINA